MKPTKLTLSLATLSMMAVSCTNDVVVDSNPDPIGDAITFSTSVRSATRSTDTKKDNLGSFGVYARALDTSDGLYTDFLIGTTDDDGGHSPEIATRSANQWDLDHKVYWPDGVHAMHFWAATTRQTTSSGNEEDILPDGAKFFFSSSPDENYPIITGFNPYQEDRKDGDNYLTYMDGANQLDLVAAFTHQEAAVHNNTAIALNFKHTLSKVNIKAKVGEGQTEHRQVKIKGAWIVNAKTGATLNLKYKKDGTNYSSDFEWMDNGTATFYGSYYGNDNAITLSNFGNDTEAKTLLNTVNATDNGILMLNPCTVEIWDKNKEENSFKNCPTDQAYILLLCRIETVHNGAAHKGEESNINTVGNSHYHQLFPHIAEGGSYNSNAYGYTCVPVDIDWKPGYSYTYVLDIFGASSGGGVYPPDLPGDLPPGIDPPSDKKPGDAILDSEIRFTVSSVEEWIDASDKNVTM